MNYYHTQLNAREAQNFFIKEFNKALAFFHKAEIIPAKLSIWRLSGGVKMGHLLRMNDEFYLVVCIQTLLNNIREIGKILR